MEQTIAWSRRLRLARARKTRGLKVFGKIYIYFAGTASPSGIPGNMGEHNAQTSEPAPRLTRKDRIPLAAMLYPEAKLSDQHKSA
jgi:hypothetical protein